MVDDNTKPNDNNGDAADIEQNTTDTTDSTLSTDSAKNTAPTSTSEPLHTYAGQEETYENADGTPTTLSEAHAETAAPVVVTGSKKNTNKWLLWGAVVLLLAGMGALAFWFWNDAEARKAENLELKKQLSSLQALSKQAATDQATGSDATVPDGYKLYEEKNIGLSFVYPEDWTMATVSQDSKEAGVVASLVSPAQHKAAIDFQKSGRQTEGPLDSDLLVSHWTDRNATGAIGGEWVGMKKPYASLDALLSDDSGGIKKKLNETTVDGKKLYIVSLGGFSESLGIMAESNGHVYQLDFVNTPSAKSDDSVVQTIIKSVKISK